MKFFEDELTLVPRHARASIENAKLDAAARTPIREQHGDLASTRCVFTGVIEQIEQDLLRGVAVRLYHNSMLRALIVEHQTRLGQSRRLRRKEPRQLMCEVKLLAFESLLSLF